MASNGPTDSDVAVEPSEPEAKRRRLLDAGGPVEDDETARQKMRDAEVGEDHEITGFDPQNVREIKGNRGWRMDPERISPMGYFARKGDLPMMRWLYVNGADTRDENIQLWFPMYAASDENHKEAVKWLFLHGATRDATRTSSGFSPLQNFIFSGQNDVVGWLILMGALCRDDGSGEIDIARLKQNLVLRSEDYPFYTQRVHELNKWRKLLLQWLIKLQQSRSSFLIFMMGTFASHADTVHRISNSSGTSLNGQQGILRLISSFVGVARGREARIIRQLTEILPGIEKD